MKIFILGMAALALFGISGVPGGVEYFACGRYSLAGKLRSGDAGAPVLQLYPGTTRRYELALSGVAFDDELWFEGETVRAEVLVFVAGKGGAARARVIGALKGVTEEVALEKPIVLMRESRCAGL